MFHFAVARMNHLGTEKSGARFAANAKALARRHVAHEAAVKIEKAQHQCAAGIGDAHDHRAARAVLNRRVSDFTFDLREHTVNQVSNRRDARFIFIAQRQMQHQIEAALETETRELCAERAAACGLGRLARGFRGGPGAGLGGFGGQSSVSQSARQRANWSTNLRAIRCISQEPKSRPLPPAHRAANSPHQSSHAPDTAAGNARPWRRSPSQSERGP